MRTAPISHHISSKKCVAFLSLLLFTNYTASADFWSLVNKGQPETVKIVRKLPAVAARNGSTVRFDAEIAGSSIPVETATILREKIRTLLLHSKTGEIQLVDGPADTEIKCVVTSYEPKVVRPGQRQVGTTVQKIETWIGNIGASVQVLDNHDHPLDAANLKNHLENDFVLSESAAKSSPASTPTTLFGKKLKLPSNLPGSSIFKTSAVPGRGSDQGTSDARNKNGRPPTDAEWREALIEGLAAKVANRIVPVDDEFEVVLPVEKEFDQIREMAKTQHWGNVQEQADKMGSLSGGKEADRLYMLGLSYEASAYAESAKPDDASRALASASGMYAKAIQIKPGEHELLLSQLRVQDAIDHYEAIQQFLQSHGGGTKPMPVVTQSVPVSGTPGGSADSEGDTNTAVINLIHNNVPESVILSFIQESKDPKFDISSKGLILLYQSKVSATIIQAIQKKMTASAGARVAPTQSAARNNKTTTRKVGGATPVQ